MVPASLSGVPALFPIDDIGVGALVSHWNFEASDEVPDDEDDADGDEQCAAVQARAQNHAFVLTPGAAHLGTQACADACDLVRPPAPTLAVC